MRRHAAFTLIELLVVVTILILLISFLLPSLAGARERAKLVKCQANLHGIGLAIATYAQQNKDIVPATVYPDWDAGQPTQQASFFHMAGWFAPPPNPAYLNWNDALYIDGVLATDAGNKNGKLDNDAGYSYPLTWEKVFTCPSNAKQLQPNTKTSGQPGQDDHGNRGYGLAYEATSDFSWRNSTGQARYLSMMRNLNPYHILAAEGWFQFGRSGVSWNLPGPAFKVGTSANYGVYLRHKQNGEYHGTFLMAGGHVDVSRDYGRYPGHVISGNAAATQPPKDVWLHPAYNP